jgi:hypothetical protein
MSQDVRSAYSASPETALATREVCEQLSGSDPAVIVFFHATSHDGRAVASALSASFPTARVLGCSSCGEFSNLGYGNGGVSAVALGSGKIGKAASAMFSVEGDVEANVQGAMEELSREFGDLRQLDPSTHVGLLLVDGAMMKEEKVNEALGNACPLLSFVGGSAGDDMKFESTLVHDATRSKTGHAVVVLMRVNGPFHILKTCNYTPTDKLFKVTRADPERRRVSELDGRPASEVYAEAIGVPVEKLDTTIALMNPLAILIEGKPWLRSISGIEGDELIAVCGVEEGHELCLVENQEIVEDTRRALREASEKLGGAKGGVLFNCAARMVEVQIKNVEEPYYAVFRDFPVAGLHAHGESWLGHMNQTLTGLLFA